MVDFLEASHIYFNSVTAVLITGAVVSYGVISIHSN